MRNGRGTTAEVNNAGKKAKKANINEKRERSSSSSSALELSSWHCVILAGAEVRRVDLLWQVATRQSVIELPFPLSHDEPKRLFCLGEE